MRGLYPNTAPDHGRTAHECLLSAKHESHLNIDVKCPVLYFSMDLLSCLGTSSPDGLSGALNTIKHDRAFNI